MGWADFFKKIFSKEEKQQKEKSLKEVELNDMDGWIGNKELEVQEVKKEVRDSVKNEINGGIEELKEKIKILENVNVDSIKSPEKIKLVVKENSKKYINDVDRLIYSLLESSESKEKKLDEFFTDIDKVFLDFEKRAHLNYEKATILIGKEMAEVKNSIKKIYDNVRNAFEESKHIISDKKSLEIVKENLNKFHEIEKFNLDLNKKNENFSEIAKDLNKKNENIVKKIEEFKKTQEHSEIIKKREELEALNKKLESEIYSLKNIIDFKYLGNIFHVNEKKMEILKSCKENFPAYFEKDSYSQLFELIKETNHEKKEYIINKIEKLKEIKKEIEQIGIFLKNDFIENKKIEIEKNNLEIKNIEEEREKILKNIEKIREKKNEVFNLIIKECKKLGVSIKIEKH